MHGRPEPATRTAELEAENRRLGAALAEAAQGEEARRVAEERLRIAQMAGGVGAFEWYPDTGRLDASDEYRRIWGLAPDTEVTADSLIAMLHPDDRSLTGPSRLGDDNPLSYVEYRLIRPDTGETRWIARRGEILEEGGARRFVGVIWDVTEQHRTACAMESLAARLTMALEAVGEGYYTLDAERRFTQVGRRALEFWGRTADQVIGHRIEDVLPAAPGSPPFVAVMQALTGRVRTRIEALSTVLPGRWVEQSAHPTPDGGVAVSFQDVTERRRARHELEAEIAERTRERDKVWRNSQDLIVVLDQAGIYRSVNPAWTEALGYAEDELIGAPFDRYLHPDDVAHAASGMAAIMRGEVLRDFDVRLRARDGAFRLYSWTCIPDSGLFYAVGRDITARRELETQLRQSQKMEAVGQLTGGIAHDFNNMLTIVMGALDLLRRRLGDDPRSARLLETAVDGANRAAGLTARLLAFSRQQPLDPRAVQVGELIDGMCELLRQTLTSGDTPSSGERLGGSVRLETAIPGDLWPVLVDPNEMESAILNLCVNARDAMADGGLLRIEARNVAVGPAHPGAPPGDCVLIAVEDQGVGMAAEVAARALEPFFTTKPVGRGTGLGLPMVYGFVRRSGGEVRILSEPGHGTTVRMYLPRHAAFADQQEGG